MTKRGFTLIELMVAISIVAILSAIGLTLFTSVQKSARDAKRKMDLHAISVALQQYYLANKTMPINRNPCCGYSQTSPNFLQELVDGGFMADIPKDPQYPNSAYAYYDYGPDNTIGAILTVHYESGDPSTLPAGTCRPWGAGQNWCDQSSNKWYCICNPY